MGVLVFTLSRLSGAVGDVFFREGEATGGVFYCLYPLFWALIGRGKFELLCGE